MHEHTMSTQGKTDLRIEVPSEALAVVDGYCQASGRHRNEVVAEILARWSDARLHESMVICRMVRVNPLAPDAARQAGGN
jgi:hypothetical protein